MSRTAVTTAAKTALCSHILHAHFGAVVGAVAETLLHRGRLSYATLLRLLPKTLTQPAVQASLLVLIQHNCLLHVSDSDDGLEYFEMDVPEILQRRRYGFFAAQAFDAFDKRAAAIIMRVFNNGKIKLSDLVDDSLGGRGRSAAASPAEYHETLKMIYDLLERGILRPVQAEDHTSKDDQDIAYERHLIKLRRENDAKAAITPKEMKLIKQQVFQRRVELDSAQRDWHATEDDDVLYLAICEEINNGQRGAEQEVEDNFLNQGQRGKRKLASADQGANKHRRLGMPFNSELFVRFHPGYFDIKLRNELIVKAVKAQRGPASGHLIHTMLGFNQRPEHTLNDLWSSNCPYTEIMAAANKRSPMRKAMSLPSDDSHATGQPAHPIAALFPKSQITASFGFENSGSWNREEKEPSHLVSEVLHTLSNTADWRDLRHELPDGQSNYAQIDRSATKPHTWIKPSKRTEQPGSPEYSCQWSVNLAFAHEELKLSLLENYLKQKFDKYAFRIWRAVDERGKMDEKQIAKLVMLPHKDIRTVIGGLSSAGFLHTQEVPRTTDRNPSKTIFLWHVSRSLCYGSLIARLYDTSVNIAVRMEHEQTINKALIRRSERSDVRDDPKLLESSDQQALEDLRWRLEVLGTAQERIDRDLFVLEALPHLLAPPSEISREND